MSLCPHCHAAVIDEQSARASPDFEYVCDACFGRQWRKIVDDEKDEGIYGEWCPRCGRHHLSHAQFLAGQWVVPPCWDNAEVNL